MGLNSLCSLSVHLRYYNKNTFVRLHNKDLFLTVLEAGKSKIQVLADSGSGESQLAGLQRAIFLYPHLVEEERAGCLVDCSRAPPS